MGVAEQTAEKLQRWGGGWRSDVAVGRAVLCVALVLNGDDVGSEGGAAVIWREANAVPDHLGNRVLRYYGVRCAEGI